MGTRMPPEPSLVSSELAEFEGLFAKSAPNHAEQPKFKEQQKHSSGTRVPTRAWTADAGARRLPTNLDELATAARTARRGSTSNAHNKPLMQRSAYAGFTVVQRPLARSSRARTPETQHAWTQGTESIAGSLAKTTPGAPIQTNLAAAKLRIAPSPTIPLNERIAAVPRFVMHCDFVPIGGAPERPPRRLGGLASGGRLKMDQQYRAQQKPLSSEGDSVSSALQKFRDTRASSKALDTAPKLLQRSASNKSSRSKAVKMPRVTMSGIPLGVDDSDEDDESTDEDEVADSSGKKNLDHAMMRRGIKGTLSSKSQLMLKGGAARIRFQEGEKGKHGSRKVQSSRWASDIEEDGSVSGKATVGSAMASHGGMSRTTTMNSQSSMLRATKSLKTYTSNFSEHYKKIAEEAAKQQGDGLLGDEEEGKNKAVKRSATFKQRKMHDLHMMSKAAKVFHMLDIDGNGQLSKRELSQGLLESRILGKGHAGVNQLMEVIGAEDGLITFEEFTGSVGSYLEINFDEEDQQGSTQRKISTSLNAKKAEVQKRLNPMFRGRPLDLQDLMLLKRTFHSTFAHGGELMTAQTFGRRVLQIAPHFEGHCDALFWSVLNGIDGTINFGKLLHEMFLPGAFPSEILALMMQVWPAFKKGVQSGSRGALSIIFDLFTLDTNLTKGPGLEHRQLGKALRAMGHDAPTAQMLVESAIPDPGNLVAPTMIRFTYFYKWYRKELQFFKQRESEVKKVHVTDAVTKLWGPFSQFEAKYKDKSRSSSKTGDDAN